MATSVPSSRPESYKNCVVVGWGDSSLVWSPWGIAFRSRDEPNICMMFVSYLGLRKLTSQTIISNVTAWWSVLTEPWKPCFISMLLSLAGSGTDICSVCCGHAGTLLMNLLWKNLSLALIVKHQLRQPCYPQRLVSLQIYLIIGKSWHSHCLRPGN